jgi:hypothetical protein
MSSNNLPDNYPGNPPDADVKNRKSGCGCGCPTGCLIALAVVFTLACLPFVFAPRIARHFLYKSASPAAIAAMDAARTKPIIFPEEWQHPKPLNLKTLGEFGSLKDELPSTATVHFHETTTTQLLRKLRAGVTLRTEEQTTIIELGNACKAYMDKYDRLTSDPENFGLDSMRNISGDPFGFSRIGRSWSEARNVQPFVTYGEALQEHWDMAFRPALVFLQAIRSTPLGILDSYRNVSTKVSMQEVCQDAVQVAQMCPTASALEPVLKELNALRSILVIPDVAIESWVISALYSLQTAKRLGFDANMQPGQPGVYYLQESIRIGMDLPMHILGRLPANSPMRKEMEQSAAVWDAGQAGISAKHLVRFGTNLMPDLLTYLSFEVSTHSGARAADREDFIARYDLLRIALANRLLELQTGSPAKSVSHLAEKYLGSEPMDPFTNKPFLYDETRAQFYSTGSNGSDDRGTSVPGTKVSIHDDIYALPKITAPKETSGTLEYDEYDTSI